VDAESEEPAAAGAAPPREGPGLLAPNKPPVAGAVVVAVALLVVAAVVVAVVGCTVATLAAAKRPPAAGVEVDGAEVVGFPKRPPPPAAEEAGAVGLAAEPKRPPAAAGAGVDPVAAEVAFPNNDGVPAGAAVVALAVAGVEVVVLPNNDWLMLGVPAEPKREAGAAVDWEVVPDEAAAGCAPKRGAPAWAGFVVAKSDAV
jgi:hypothetical protein